MAKKKRYPVGDVFRKPVIGEDSHISPEMDCREGEHPASEISEHAFRRGFQQAVHMMQTLLLRVDTGDARRVARAAAELAFRMRYDGKPHPDYMREAYAKLVKRLGIPAKGGESCTG